MEADTVLLCPLFLMDKAIRCNEMEIIMKRWKWLVSFMMAVCLFAAGMQMHGMYADETVNPISCAATEMSDDGNFIVSIKFEEDFVMKAYQFTVRYDASQLETSVENESAFGYYQAFINAYQGNQQGLAACHHIVSDASLIFAGAQPKEEAAAIKAKSRCAYIRFHLKAKEKTTESYEQALQGITVTVETLFDGKEDQAATHPELFANPLVPVTGDTVDENDLNSNHQDILLGDVSKDGKVQLDDAQITLQCALGIISLPEEDKEIADVDHDGRISLEDARIVLQAALGIIKLE